MSFALNLDKALVIMPCRIKAGNSNDTGVEKVNTNIVTMSEKKKEKTIEKCIL